MAVPLLTKKIVKKRGKKFKRPQYDRRICVKAEYDDNCCRPPVSFASLLWKTGADPRVLTLVSDGSSSESLLCPTLVMLRQEDPHYLPNGFKKFVVHNISELELLMMHNRTYCAEIAHNVSTRKRKVIVERAAQLDVAVANKVAQSGG